MICPLLSGPYVQLDSVGCPQPVTTIIRSLGHLGMLVIAVVYRLYIWVGVLVAFNFGLHGPFRHLRASPQGGGCPVSSSLIPPNPFSEAHGVLSNRVLTFKSWGNLKSWGYTDQLRSRERTAENYMRFTKC